VLHVSHIGRVPYTNIFIEVVLRSKQLPHICHAGHVPVADVSILLLCRSTIRAPELHCLTDIFIHSAQSLIEQQRAKYFVDEIGIESYKRKSLPQSIQSRNHHVEFVCCRWLQDFFLPSITYSNLLKLRNNTCHLNQQSVLECWRTSKGFFIRWTESKVGAHKCPFSRVAAAKKGSVCTQRSAVHASS